ncbi:hypothetical protein ABZP36_011801 [Zizania latifolia]
MEVEPSAMVRATGGRKETIWSRDATFLRLMAREESSLGGLDSGGGRREEAVKYGGIRYYLIIVNHPSPPLEESWAVGSPQARASRATTDGRTARIGPRKRSDGGREMAVRSDCLSPSHVIAAGGAPDIFGVRLLFCTYALLLAWYPLRF